MDTEKTVENEVTEVAEEAKVAAAEAVEEAAEVVEAAEEKAVEAVDAVEEKAEEAAEAVEEAAEAVEAAPAEEAAAPAEEAPAEETDRREARAPRQQNNRKRKKVCAFCADKIDEIDYKDTLRLRKYVSERAKILPRRVTGTCARHQRQLTTAIKRARQVALMPYISD